MKVVGGIVARARLLSRIVGDGILDSGKAALYVRQLLRGNRAPPSILTVPRMRQTAAGQVLSAPAAGGRLSAGSPRGDVAAPKAPPQPELPPVLLLHGYLATRGSVHLLEERLTAFGHVVMTYRLGPIQLGDIRDSAGFIARKVDSLVAQTGVDKVDIVAHSMGGLVALDYLKRLQGHRRIRRLILLGTPISGTWSALLGIATAPLGRAALQLLPGSAFLRELAGLAMPAGPEVTAISGDRDWLAPPHTTFLSGVRSLALPTGHSGLLVDESVACIISDLLCAPSTNQADAIPTGPGHRIV